MGTEETARRLLTTVIVVSVVVLAGTAALVWSPTLREMVGVGPTVEPPPYQSGDVVDVPASVYQSSNRTLLLFARSDCAACQRSESFHQSVIAAAAAADTAVALMSPTVDTASEVSYAARLGVPVDHVHAIAPGSIKLRTVPTLMLVDATGRIQHVWFGATDAAEEALILDAVTNGHRP